ncbi:MAG: substrate-binding domain-containing protein [Syntrophales bacterium]|jgi:phosphate transport system substrate-binding protein|nr:substrate-binding domain-containing protein [Syntrophales bacterium]
MRRATSILLNSFFLILLSLIFFARTPHALAGNTIRINGSGSGLEMMKPLMEAYGKASRGVSFIVEKPLGSSGAIKALLAGTIDIAIISKPLKPKEIAQGGKLRYFGETPLAIVTGRKVPLKTISIKELEDIYSGKTTKWPNGETIRIVLRPNEDIDTYILKGLSPGMAEAVTKAQRRQGMIIAVTDPESNEVLSKTIGGIGASGLTGVLIGRLHLNVLALNGVMPSRKTLADGTYPLAKSINFVTTGKLPHAASKFLDFIYSNKGHAIAEKAGVLITADGK